MASLRGDPGDDPGGGRFSPRTMYQAASMYYLQDATQAEVAHALGTSRATVSRLLSEARRRGMVRIEVIRPLEEDDPAAAELLASRLGIRAVHLGPARHVGAVGTLLSTALSGALERVGLGPGDVLLVSSGRTVYEAARGDLPRLPGILVAPMVGGQEEPDAWYQTNEITRQVADKVGGHPVFLHAPALPGPDLRDRLLEDDATRRVFDLWSHARCAIVGVGAPPRVRSSLAKFVPRDPALLERAVGDVCNNYYGPDGEPVSFPGSERLIAIRAAALRALPTSIAIAAGRAKVPSIIGAARAGFFTELVTDPPTAAAILNALDDAGGVTARASEGA